MANSRAFRSKSLALRLLNRTGVGGLIGKFSFDPQEPLSRSALDQMIDDSQGPATSRDFVTAPGIALGVHGRRTSIAALEQPLLRVAANTAITNAAAIRAELSACDHAFDTASDAELILRAYARWSIGCFGRLRGPFACALWDAAARRLVLARDQIGIRPLHFAVLPNQGVLFASDIRSVISHPDMSREWCPDAIDTYLAFGYVPAPLTAFRRITSLEPAHVLIVEGRRLHIERYWDVPAPQSLRLDDALERGRQDVRRVIDDQASRADESLLYSGGLGSTTLLACAAQPLSPVLTVDFGLDGAERARTERAANHLGYSTERVEPEPIAAGLVRELAAHFDQPVADPRAVTQLALCRAARQRTDSACTATGATALWSQRPSQPRQHLDEHCRHALYTRAFAWQVRDSDPFARQTELLEGVVPPDPPARARYVDAHTRLPGSEIVIAERAAAAAGLELRYPLLDPILVASAAAIRAQLTSRRAGTSALQLLLSPLVPRNLLPSPKNRPAAGWLAAALLPLVPGTLLSARFDSRDIVSRPTLRRLWEEHASGRRDHGGLLWSLLMLELWFRHRVDNDASDEPEEYAVRRAA